MTLRRKLLSVFSALALMSFLSGGLTIWSTVKQHTLLAGLEEKYLQSVILSRVRVASGTLFRRHAMAVLVEAQRGSDHFDELDEKIRKDLEALGDHVSRPEDIDMAEKVTGSYASVVQALATALASATSDENMPASEIVRPAHEGYQELSALLELHFERNREERRVLRARLKRLRETVLFAVGISGFGTLCLVLLLAVYVGSDIFRPLRRLETAMRSVSEGDLDVKLEVGRDDELGRLIDAFHHMTDALSERIRSGGGTVHSHPSTEPTLTESDARRIVYDTVAANQHILAERAVGITVEVASDLPNLCIEEGRLREVTSLLLREALATCSVGGRLWLQLTREGGLGERARVEVAHENPNGPLREEALAKEDTRLASEDRAARLDRIRELAETARGTFEVEDVSDSARRMVVRLTMTPSPVVTATDKSSEMSA